MLTPKAEGPKQPNAAVISIRLTELQHQHLEWLMGHLNMTRTEVLQGLIEQEYQAQSACILQ